VSIDTLKQDLKQVVESIPQGPLVTAADLADYIRTNLVPFVSNLVDELSEVDDCIGALVNEAEDILHEDNAKVFAGIIASGNLLVSELRIRVGNDKRVLSLVREYEILAAKGVQILGDIVVPDDPDEDPDDPDDDDDDSEVGAGSAPKQDGAA
jgi:hypothetical protein